MPVETVTYVNSLNASNPAASDPLSQADDHLRLIKAALLVTFPNLNGTVTATPTQLNQLAGRTLGLADGSATLPSVYFDAEAALGFYRASAGHLSLSQGKRLNGNGTVPTGALVHFAKQPGSFSSGGAPGTNTEWLECDGSVYNFSDFPDLAAFLVGTFGGNGTTTFGVPNTKDTGRFLRSRTGAVAAGTSQANTTASHTHTASGTTASNGGHNHTITDPGHRHFIANSDGTGNASPTITNSNHLVLSNVVGSASGNYILNGTATESTVGLTSSSTTGSTIADGAGAHTHTISLTTDATGSSETRPEALTTFLCIKT